jgi:hypothetical protein
VAKIFDPSGETEFFEVTELQQAFEKELKTGEKVTVSAGVKEASILREAPIRSDLAGLYQEFKDRILNPYVPPQPPVFTAICNRSNITRYATWNIDFGFEYDPTTDDLGCYARFKSSVLSIELGAPNYNFDTKYPATTFDGSGEFYFNSPFPQSTGVQTGAQQFASTIPDWLTMEGFLGCEVGENLNWFSQNKYILTDSIIINWLYGGAQQYVVPATFSLDLPNLIGGQEIKLWEIKADLFLPAFSSPNQGCYKNLTNIRFTNLYS